VYPVTQDPSVLHATLWLYASAETYNPTVNRDLVSHFSSPHRSSVSSTLDGLLILRKHRMAETRLEAVMRENAAELERRTQGRLGIQPTTVIGTFAVRCLIEKGIARMPKEGCSLASNGMVMGYKLGGG
jgi:hypothetical protein